MGGADNSFPLRDQLFVEFLPGPEADVLDLNIRVRLKARPPNEVSRHTVNLDRGPHVIQTVRL